MGLLPPALRPLRHELAVRFEKRTNYTFTRFYRLPGQYDALVNAVVPLVTRSSGGEALEIISVGCSTGAEPYSVASVLSAAHPDLTFRIRAFDLDSRVLAQAREGRYTRDEVLASESIPQWFVEQTFDNDGSSYSVKPHIMKLVTFEQADVLDNDLRRNTDAADLVFCQNLLVNLPYGSARAAFWNIQQICRTNSALFLDGMPLGLRERLTRRAGLRPLDHLIPEIHEDVLRLHAAPWPWHYWGVEPLREKKGWKQRYSTIYLRGLESTV